ncbi:MAG: hypothetical protein V7754_10190, partial [Halioglobus sp.]
LREALDEFSALCASISGIEPGPSFDGWGEDAMLGTGVAINPQAAAHCVKDYRRSVVFIRGVYAALKVLRKRFPDTPIQVLYAGCGPFATLLLPLLGRFHAGVLDITLLEIHRRSLDSVGHLIDHFGFTAHAIEFAQVDASHYQHHSKPHLVIAETMQKALEQEPQLAVTANLAPQLCTGGILIPEKIEVELCLAPHQQETQMILRDGDLPHSTKRHSLGTLIELTAHSRALFGQLESSSDELGLAEIRVPRLAGCDQYDLVMYTRIDVFAHHGLGEYESEITLPLKCHDVPLLSGGELLGVRYQLGAYPKIGITVERE